MSTKDKLISNTAYLFLNWIIITAFSMAFWMILGKTVDKPSLGIVATAIQLSSLIVPIVLLGMDSMSNRLIPLFINKDDKERVRGIIEASVKYVLAASLIAAAALFLSASYISPILKIDELMIWMAGIIMVVMAQTYLLGAFYYGLQDMKKYFITNLAGQISLVVAELGLIWLGWGYVGAAVAYLLSFGVTLGMRISPKLLTMAKKSNIDRKMIFQFSIPALWVMIFSVIFTNTQYLILSSLKDLSATGSFAVATKVIAVIATVPLLFTNALFPITAGLCASGGSKRKQSYLIALIFRYSIMIVAPIALYMVIFAKELVYFFSTAEFLDSVSLFPFLAIGAIFTGLANQFLTSLYALGHPKEYRNSYIVSTIFYIFSAIGLTYMFSGIGLAASYMMSAIILFFTTFFFIRKYTTLRLPYGSILKISAALGLSLVVLYPLMGFVVGIKSAILCSSAAGIAYLVILGFMGFYTTEDLDIYDSVAGRLPLERSKFLKDLALAVRGLVKSFVKRKFSEGYS
jgi:O-antigen/teichoic acid export membrane protein